MVYLSKVTSRGQVTIPQELREEDGIDPNDYVVVRRVGKSIVLSKADIRLDEITASFEKEARSKGITKEDLMEELQTVRNAKRK